MKKITSRQAGTGGSVPKPPRWRSGAKRVRKKAEVLLTPGEVSLLRDLYESGMWSIKSLAIKFEISAAHAEGVVKFKLHA